MTYEYNVICSRASTETPFYTAPENVTNHIDAVWRPDGKYATEEVLTEDRLTKIVRVTFKDVEHWLEFINDPIINLAFNERNEYNIVNDITVTRLAD